MGALNFAMDRLATISSLLAPSKIRTDRLDLSGFEFKLDDISRRALDEFATGMKMLHKHGVRNGCDISAITCQNIKLLHSNLKDSANYRNTLSLLRNNSAAMHTRVWIPLLENRDLIAGLLFLAPDTSISPNQQNAKLKVHQNEQQTAFAVPHINCQVTQLYVNITGKIQISLHKPVLNRLSDPVTLKHGDAFAEDSSWQTVDRLTTGKDACLLLNIRLLTS